MVEENTKVFLFDFRSVKKSKKKYVSKRPYPRPRCDVNGTIQNSYKLYI